jgi:hypothetical protein
MEKTLRLLLEAAHVEGEVRAPGAFVRSARVIRRAMEAAGQLTPEANRWLEDEADETDAEAARFYDVLVRLVCGPGFEPLLEGQGNFGFLCYGHPDHPPAHPRYTECRITERARQYLEDVGGSDAVPPA